MSEYDQRVCEIAREYNIRCDTYDALVCTGHHAMPATNREYVLINKHAVGVMREMKEKASAIGVDWKDVRREITRWGVENYSYSVY